MLKEDTHRKIEQEAKSDSSMHENYIHVLVAKMIVNEIFNEHEAQLKAKDVEIERLKGQLSTVHNLMYMNGYSDAIDCYDTFGKFNIMAKPNAKARSIVAMLFWNYKRNLFAFDVEATVVVESKRIFEKAYKC